MGSNTSDLTLSEIEEMQQCSNFSCIVSQREIKKLYKRFKRLDRDNFGRITIDSLLSIPELAMNPLATRIISLFDSRHDDLISFKQFIETLSIMSEKGSREDKLKFVFMIYDIKRDGFIDVDELYQVLKMLVGNNLSEYQLRTIAEKAIQDVDKDEDDKISFQEFSEALSIRNLQEMSIHL